MAPPNPFPFSPPDPTPSPTTAFRLRSSNRAFHVWDVPSGNLSWCGKTEEFWREFRPPPTVDSIIEIPSCSAPLGSSQYGIPAASAAARSGSHSRSAPSIREICTGPSPPCHALGPRQWVSSFLKKGSTSSKLHPSSPRAAQAS